MQRQSQGHITAEKAKQGNSYTHQVTNLLAVAIVSAAVQSFRPLHPLVCENTTEELGLPPGFLCRREGEETSDTVETPTWLAQKIPIHKDMKTSLTFSA